jgi:hypothetical protein
MLLIVLHCCVGVFKFDFEDEQLNEGKVRDLVYEEILYYHPQ